MILNAVEYYNEGTQYGNIVNVMNTIFVTIYGLESVFKLIGLRLHFFRDKWNIFDLSINILSIICKYEIIYTLNSRKQWHGIKISYLLKFLHFSQKNYEHPKFKKV